MIIEKQEDQINEEWKYHKIGEISTIIRGISFPKESKYYEPRKDFIACLRTTNIQQEVEWDDLWFIPNKYVKREEQIVRTYDILISTANSLDLVGKVALVKLLRHNATLGAFISLIRVADCNNPKFIYYQLSSSKLKDCLRKIASTTTNISNISSSKLAEIEINIPSLQKQNQVVAKIEELLSQLEAGVEAFILAKEKLKQYKASVLKAACKGKLVPQDPNDEPAAELLRRLGKKPLEGKDLPALPVGWCWTTLNSICQKIQDGIHFSPKEQYHEPGIDRFLYITAKNIKENGIILNDVTYIDSKTHHLNSKRCDPKVNDVLLIKDGITTGTATVNKIKEEFTLLSSVAFLRPIKEILDPFYLKHYLNSNIGYKIITGSMTGTAIKRIILARIKTSYIPLPPINEQKRIVIDVEQRLSLTQTLEETFEAEMKRTNKLRQTILKTAFEGKL